MKKFVIVHILMVVAATAAIAAIDYQFAHDKTDASVALISGCTAMFALLWLA